MDKMFVTETARKYNRTTALIKCGDAVQSVFIESIVSDDQSVAWLLGSNLSYPPTVGVVNSSRKEVKIKLKEVKILPMPDTRVFDYNGRTLVFKRVPNKQWRKGLCSENSLVLDPMYDLLKVVQKAEIKFLIREIKMDSVVAHHLFSNNHAQTFHDALLDIEKHSLMSRSVSNAYWLGLLPTDEFTLYRYEVPLAIYDKGKDTFTLIGKGFHQEVLDFVKRLKLHSEVLL